MTGYQVSAGGTTQTVTGTSAQLTGFPDNSPVNVTVKAVNAAGPGAAASTVARTIGPPALTGGTASASGLNAISVSFTTNNNGGATACSISVNGGGATGIGCNGGTVSGLWPGATYNFISDVPEPSSGLLALLGGGLLLALRSRRQTTRN